jgi:RimJ/RimL family protein N-acetyltransferase
MERFKLKSGKTLIIKEACPQDAHRIVEYCQAIGGETDYLSFGANEYPKTAEEVEQIIESFAKTANQLYIFGELDGHIVGLLDVVSSQQSRLRHSGEFGISVRKDYWGLGIGSHLIEYMLDWAKEGNIIKKLNLKVISNNESAIKLYRKFDFTMEGRISKEFYVNGRYYDMISMGFWIEKGEYESILG